MFAPLLIFFAITGAWQTFMLHRGAKDGTYIPPRILHQLSSVHQFQEFPVNEGAVRQSHPFRWFVLAMAVGFVITAVLGVIMAFKFTRSRWIVWLCLTAGFILPVLLLYVGGGIR